MKTSRPKSITLLISIILVVIGLVAQFAMGGTLLFSAFIWVVLGYALLLLGNLFTEI